MQFNASATQIAHRDERIGRVESEGSTGDHPKAIIGSLDNPVGQALLNVGEHAFLLGPDRPRNLDEWRELGPAWRWSAPTARPTALPSRSRRSPGSERSPLADAR